MSETASHGDAIVSASAAPQGGIVRVPMRVGGWACKGLDLGADDRLTVRFESIGTRDWIEIVVLPGTTPGPAFRRLRRCIVRYRGTLTEATDERRGEVFALVLGVSEAIDARLVATPGSTIAEALGRTRAAGKLIFGRDTLRALLAPEIHEGAPLVEGWSLMDVYPSSHLRETLGVALELVLDFRRAKDLRRMLIVVQRRDDEKPAFARTTHFSLAHIGGGVADPPGGAEVRALVSFVLQLRDHEGLEVHFPDVTSDVAGLLLAAAPDPVADAAASDDILNLAISSDCGQSCSFCSIKDAHPAEDGGDRVLARLYADLASNRQRGVRAVRVNGYDPLTYSRILDVMHRAKFLGYERADVFSPCTLLAERAFCEQVIEALPPTARFYVPLYGVDAEAHDRVVGRQGAFALVMKAVANITELSGKESVSLLSVATKEGLDDLVAIAGFADARGLRFYPHMPYPSFETRSDRFYESAPRQTDVASRSVTAKRSKRLHLHVHGVAPCVTFRAMAEARVRVSEWLQVPDRPPTLPGTEYREERFRHRAGEADHSAFHASAIPCPHVAKCTVRDACSGEVLRSYAELYGMEEFQPVSLRDLVAST